MNMILPAKKISFEPIIKPCWEMVLFIATKACSLLRPLAIMPWIDWLLIEDNKLTCSVSWVWCRASRRSHMVLTTDTPTPPIKTRKKLDRLLARQFGCLSYETRWYWSKAGRTWLRLNPAKTVAKRRCSYPCRHRNRFANGMYRQIPRSWRWQTGAYRHDCQTYQ